MSRHVVIEKAGAGLGIQDLGRPGQIGVGLSRGGAVDRAAFLQGLALLDNAIDSAAFEIAGIGGRFRFDAPVRIALTGAKMRATIDGETIEPLATHALDADNVLEIGAVSEGVYGYLHIGGGLDTKIALGGRGLHRIAGLGRPCSDGDRLTLGTDTAPDAPPLRLNPPAPSKEAIRVMAGPQTALFSQATRDAFASTTFIRSPRGNRQGVRLDHDGGAFATGGQLSQVSDFITEGDIQMTGDGTPYVLLAECQTMGGYPRIGTVLPADLPRVAQAMPGAELHFRFVTLDEAEATFRTDAQVLSELQKRLTRSVRNPTEMSDLLSYNLIGGVVSGQDADTKT